MCGLSGMWQPGGGREEALRARVAAMAATLVHRGPDDGGCYVDAPAGVAFGFRRLAIVDLSPAGHQPMRSADGRYVLVFNGEIYNYRELRARLVADGTVFRGASDTEALLELVAQLGVRDAIPELWGMFALAVWDTHDRTLWLARDRLGKKPLYYGRTGDGTWLFGSELKSLHAHPGCPLAIDRDAVAALLRYGCIPAPASIYRGIAKLPPGHLARLRIGSEPMVEPYWRARTTVEAAVTQRREISDAEAIDEAEALLRDAVHRRMIADVPLGAFLSGGLDSTAVVALMQASSGARVRTFTIGFADPAYDEAADAAAVAAHLGTEHTSLRVTPDDALAIVPRLPAIYDEPFADSSQIPTAIVSALARPHVTVALSGDGGDEMFGGYTRHVWAERAWRRISLWPRLLRQGAGAAGARIGPAAWDAAAAFGQRLLPAAARQRQPADKLRKLVRLLDARDVDDMYRILVAQWDRPSAALPGSTVPISWAEQEAAGLVLPSVAERMIFQDLTGYLHDDILVKVDRASMAVGLEARAPLLDHRLVDFMWRLPLSMRIRDGRGKWLLRRIVDRHVSPALMDRPKTGFGLPIGTWLRGPLRDWAEPLLAPAALEDGAGFDAAVITVAWQRHLAGQAEEQRLWPVLMFQAWRRHWCRPSREST
jgi:asparagine synthase (glutamine-hydrolysing)